MLMWLQFPAYQEKKKAYFQKKVTIQEDKTLKDMQSAYLVIEILFLFP